MWIASSPPVLDALRSEFEGRITFRSADVDDPGLASFCRECEVVNVPALGCFVKGRRVKTMVGSRPMNVLRAEFAALVGDVGASDQAVLQTRPQVSFPGRLWSLVRRYF